MLSGEGIFNHIQIYFPSVSCRELKVKWSVILVDKVLRKSKFHAHRLGGTMSDEKIDFTEFNFGIEESDEQLTPVVAFDEPSSNTDSKVQDVEEYDFSMFNFHEPEDDTVSLQKNERQEIIEKFLEENASTGDPDAQYRAAVYFVNRKSKRYSDHLDEKKKVFQWSKLSADQGHRRAQALAGFCYACGIGTEVKDELAIHYYLLSAKQRYSVAECCLGNFYLGGYHVEKNPHMALYWYLKGARHGSPDAMLKLSELYNNKVAGKYNLKRAFKWLLKAAQRGSTDAKVAVAIAYFYGNGTTRDYDKFLYWTKVAAADNNWRADNMLEYASEYIALDKWSLQEIGLPLDFEGIFFRRRTVVKMQETNRLPIKEMLDDLKQKRPKLPSYQMSQQMKLLKQLQNLNELEGSISPTRH